MREENPVNSLTARRMLSPGLNGEGKPVLMGATRFSALKRAMGLTGRFVLVSQMRKYLREHPDFKESDVYPRRRKAVGE